MPVYEYQCEECGESFELFVRSISSEKNAECPKCGSRQVRRALSLFGVGGSSSSRASQAACSPASV